MRNDEINLLKDESKYNMEKWVMRNKEIIILKERIKQLEQTLNRSNNTYSIILENKELKERIESLSKESLKFYNELILLREREQKMPDIFIKWQEKCCCDFIEPRNNHEHSLTCKERFKEIVEKNN